MSEWIKTEDRLPEDDIDVLCRFVGWDDMDVLRTLSYDAPFKEWSDWNGEVYETITHWQPLPKPPKQ